MNYSRIVFISAITLILYSLVSCINCVEPQGVISTEKTKLDNFTKIEVSIPANIKIITGDSTKISITSYESYLSAITTAVRRGKLILKGDICNAVNSQVDILITLPELSEISISGSANIFSETPVRTDDLTLEISGSGDIILNVFANTIASDISGSGNININGTCQNLIVDIAGSGEVRLYGFTDRAQLSITGSGDISALNLEINDCFANIAGSGDMYIWANDLLDADILGSGDIYYIGSPLLDIRITGTGNVYKY